jgi:hypothetical protein
MDRLPFGSVVLELNVVDSSVGSEFVGIADCVFELFSPTLATIMRHKVKMKISANKMKTTYFFNRIGRLPCSFIFSKNSFAENDELVFSSFSMGVISESAISVICSYYSNIKI